MCQHDRGLKCVYIGGRGFHNQLRSENGKKRKRKKERERKEGKRRKKERGKKKKGREKEGEKEVDVPTVGTRWTKE